MISGRGELMLEILLTQMRREGLRNDCKSKSLIKNDDKGNKLEPIENYNGFRGTVFF